MPFRCIFYTKCSKLLFDELANPKKVTVFMYIYFHDARVRIPFTPPLPSLRWVLLSINVVFRLSSLLDVACEFCPIKKCRNKPFCSFIRRY